MIKPDEELIAAFRPEWERLGVVASRLGIRHGNMIAKRSQVLRDRGIVESKFNGACLSWRLAAGQDEAPTGELTMPPPPPKLTPYCPPVELEGPHCGLVELMAQRLWRKARSYSSKSVDAATWADRPENVKMAWREVAYDALLMLFDIGFTGPAGHPDPERFDRFTYAWNYEASSWEILDGEGGYVALVNESADVELLIAAPGMMTAINALLGAIPPGHPAREMRELQELELSLPEHRESAELQKERDNAGS